MSSESAKPNRYRAIIEEVFKRHYKKGCTSVEFSRVEFDSICDALRIERIKNLGDMIYTFRYRGALPKKITDTAKAGYEWLIIGKGRALYELRQFKIVNIVPRDELLTIKIPDATPEIIATYALGDEQALLAKVRYNRLIDIFLGITAYSLQNHLRTTVEDVGQIEIDEIYVGVDRNGRQFVVPVQAKGGRDKHRIIQTLQDLAFCKEKYPDLICRAVSAQFMANHRIAMFELTIERDEIKVVEEKHYTLVPSDEITAADLKMYRTSAR